MATKPHGKKQKSLIFLVDDHPVMREGIALLINQQPDLLTCGQATSGDEALAQPALRDADLVIVDLMLQQEGGLDLIRRMRRAKPMQLFFVYTMHDAASHAIPAFRAGARGFLQKTEPPPRLIEGIRDVIAGRLFLDRALSEVLFTRLVDGTMAQSSLEPGGNLIESLSERELRVFKLIGEGFSSQQIAARLKISGKTVQTYRDRIKSKLGIPSARALLQQATFLAHGTTPVIQTSNGERSRGRAKKP